MIRRLKLIWLFLAVIAPFLYIGRVSAEGQTNQPQGLTVSPAFQQVSLPAGASSVPITFSITNNRPVDQAISLSVHDFNALNESGGLFFVGTNPTALQKKYGLAKWVSLESSQLNVPAGQTVEIHASILNLPDLSAGGHYGALMISLGGSNQTAGQVGVQPIASSLLFVTKTEGATHRLSLSGVYPSRSLTKLPANVALRFYNDGNTHLVPRGVVSLMQNGKQIGRGIINENSNIILPQTFRSFSVRLNKTGPASLGSYELKVDFRFDGVSQFRSFEQSYLYLPSWCLWLAGLILGVAVILYKRAYILARFRKHTASNNKHKT